MAGCSALAAVLTALSCIRALSCCDRPVANCCVRLRSSAGPTAGHHGMYHRTTRCQLGRLNEKSHNAVKNALTSLPCGIAGAPQSSRTSRSETSRVVRLRPQMPTVHQQITPGASQQRYKIVTSAMPRRELVAAASVFVQTKISQTPDVRVDLDKFGTLNSAFFQLSVSCATD